MKTVINFAIVLGALAAFGQPSNKLTDAQIAYLAGHQLPDEIAEIARPGSKYWPVGSYTCPPYARCTVFRLSSTTPKVVLPSGVVCFENPWRPAGAMGHYVKTSPFDPAVILVTMDPACPQGQYGWFLGGGK